MTTAYVSTDEWADKKGYATFAAYIADDNPEPNETKLESFLKQATRILNNRQHLACGTTNITNSDYIEDIQDYCITIANRMMDVDRNRGFMGGGFTFSPQDFLYTYERNDINQIAREVGYKVVGLVG